MTLRLNSFVKSLLKSHEKPLGHPEIISPNDKFYMLGICKLRQDEHDDEG